MASISNAEIIANEAMLAGLDPEAEYLTSKESRYTGKRKETPKWEEGAERHKAGCNRYPAKHP